MQTLLTSLAASQLEQLKQSLVRWQATRGSLLLGAQLGQLVGDVIHPASLKGFGGLKALVERELLSLVVPVSEPGSADIRYQIVLPPGEAVLATPTHDLTLEGERKVAGAELWRLFANPRLGTTLAANTAGDVFAAAAEHQLSTGLIVLRKLTSEDYRLLAGQFAATLPASADRERMQAALQAPEFYNGWIATLRQARTPEMNPLKQWEAVRAEHVARRLGDELRNANVDDARAAEIVAAARPNLSAQASRVAMGTDAAHGQASAVATTPPPSAVRGVTDDTSLMREMLHLAIDKMALNELLEIRIPAGLLLEISRQRRA